MVNSPSPGHYVRCCCVEKGAGDLTLACGSGLLLGAMEELNALARNGQIRKAIDSYGLLQSAAECKVILARALSRTRKPIEKLNQMQERTDLTGDLFGR
jgi:hypothetical protein